MEDKRSNMTIILRYGVIWKLLFLRRSVIICLSTTSEHNIIHVTKGDTQNEERQDKEE
ncbi:hypothetical protein LGL08_20170 [Clostridium estertheticum]|uniref:hypothetical protein n=1 Tax=Clostridium estertheticum TaxID=238834 RepID=UPI001CF43539|nr:hypothetical protein [Clostridium estertheticum]MCB2309022.1 hypothetical protein [Clostridium estertheticum]MCB2346844.1 hypothetical protein [Clostridium estertheticum]MCB2351844.1 hypothetical protein [Clostridium estertheticum]WAG48447.1 hypothetical protein LL127_22975 [Clostridium estertheticum]